MNRLFGALALSLLPSTLPAQGDEGFDLRPNLQRGERLYFVDQTEQQIEVLTPSDPPKKSRQSLAIQRLFALEVQQIRDDGSMRLMLLIARVHGQVRMPVGVPKKFDSLDEDLRRDPKKLAGISPNVRAWLADAGKVFWVQLDARGKVRGTIQPPPKRLEQSDSIDKARQARLKRLVESVFGRTPEGPVALRAQWDHELRHRDPSLPTVQATKVRLSKASKNAFELQIRGTLKTDPALAKGNTILIDGTIAGTQTLERGTGLVLTMKLDGDSKLQFPGMDLPGTMKLSSRLRRATRDDLRPVEARAAAGGTRPAEAARIARARTDALRLANAVRAYYAKFGKLPDDLKVLATKDRRGRSEIEKLTPDSWGNAYELVTGDSPRTFYVRSRGPDGKAGTADDIDSRRDRR